MLGGFGSDVRTFDAKSGQSCSTRSRMPEALPKGGKGGAAPTREPAGSSDWVYLQVSIRGLECCEQQEGLFQPLLEGVAPHACKYGGTRLGLAISRCFVK